MADASSVELFILACKLGSRWPLASKCGHLGRRWSSTQTRTSSGEAWARKRAPAGESSRKTMTPTVASRPRGTPMEPKGVRACVRGDGRKKAPLPFLSTLLSLLTFSFIRPAALSPSLPSSPLPITSPGASSSTAAGRHLRHVTPLSSAVRARLLLRRASTSLSQPARPPPSALAPSLYPHSPQRTPLSSLPPKSP